MPSKTPAQHRLMASECTKPSGKVPQAVACEFMHADKGKKVAKGKKPKRKKA